MMKKVGLLVKRTEDSRTMKKKLGKNGGGDIKEGSAVEQIWEDPKAMASGKIPNAQSLRRKNEFGHSESQEQLARFCQERKMGAESRSWRESQGKKRPKNSSQNRQVNDTHSSVETGGKQAPRGRKTGDYRS